MEVLNNQWVVVGLGAALAISEVLSMIPSIKSNGIFQLVYNTLKAITGKGGGK